MYFMSINSVNNKIFTYVTPCRCMKLAAYSCRIDNTLVSASTRYSYHTHCDKWLVFISFSFCKAIKLKSNQKKSNQKFVIQTQYWVRLVN